MSSASQEIHPPEAFFAPTPTVRPTARPMDTTGKMMSMEAEEDEDFADLIPPTRRPSSVPAYSRSSLVGGGSNNEVVEESLPKQREAQMRRFAESKHMLQGRSEGLGSGPFAAPHSVFGRGMFGDPHHPFGDTSSSSSFPGSSWRSAMDSKLPASLLVIVLSIIVLYFFTPSFVTLPATSAFGTPGPSHVHILLISLAAGIITFALQCVSS